MSHGYTVVTISSDFNYLSPAIDSKKLIAKAHQVKHGKTISVYDVSVYDDKDKLISKGTFSYYNLGKPIFED